MVPLKIVEAPERRCWAMRRREGREQRPRERHRRRWDGVESEEGGAVEAACNIARASIETRLFEHRGGAIGSKRVVVARSVRNGASASITTHPCQRQWSWQC